MQSVQAPSLANATENLRLDSLGANLNHMILLESTEIQRLRRDECMSPFKFRTSACLMYHAGMSMSRELDYRAPFHFSG